MKMALLLVLLCLLCFCCSVRSQQSNYTTILDNLLASYDRRQSPDLFTNETVTIEVGIYVLELYAISDDNMQYSASLFFRRRWTDPRLDFSRFSPFTFVVRSDFIDSIWTPDIFFTNERDGYFHNITQNIESIWLEQDGTVNLAARYSLVLGCPMDLQKYPFDTQFCELRMQTYSYQTHQVRLQWRSQLPLELPESLYLQSFTLDNYYLENCASDYLEYENGSPCLRAVFTLTRDYGFQLIQSYVPSSFIIVLSWVGFWIPPDAVPARITLGSSTVLTVIFQSFYGGLLHPQAPYLKAVDVWMATALTFVLCALIEFAIVNKMLRSEQKQLASRRLLQLTMPNLGAECDENRRTTLQQRQEVLHHLAAYVKELYLHNQVSKADKIDYFSRIAFPAAFGIFLIAYYAYYL